MPEEHPPSGAALLQRLLRHRVTHLVAVPSLLHYLAGLPRARAGLAHLQHVVSSGGVLTSATAQAVRAALPAQAALWNVYGCAECTADVTAHLMAAGAVLLRFPLRQR
jgi:acyl-coenzyme A synthetase/AMP-(fatty) acid ligase